MEKVRVNGFNEEILDNSSFLTALSVFPHYIFKQYFWEVFMKKAFLASFCIFFLIFSDFYLFGNYWNTNIGSFKVGKQPVGFILDEKNKTLNIFCAGYDENFNGIKEAGDEAPSWWQASILDPSNSEDKVIEDPYLAREFEFGSFQFPFRPGYIYPKIYYSSLDNIEIYNIGNLEKIDKLMINITASALSANQDLLLISHRISFTEPGFVYIYDLNNNKFIDTLKAGVNVQQALFYENDKIVVLNEGDYGGSNSSIQVFKLDGTKYNLDKTITTGDATNHITINDNILIATNNNSHDLTIIDLSIYEIKGKIKFPTEGFNGPRESVYSSKLDQIITSCYDGNIYVHNLKGDFIEVIEPEGKPEGLLLVESPIPLLFVANEYVKDTYDPNSTIEVFSTKTSYVKEFVPPKPKINFDYLSEIIEIELFSNVMNNISVSLYNSIGKLIFNKEINISSNTIQIDLKEKKLANGYYFLLIQNDQQFLSFPFILSR